MPSRAHIRAGLLTTCAILLTSGLLTGSAVAQEKPVNIVVVDLERVVGQSAAGQALQGQLAKFQEEVKTEGELKAETTRSIRQRISDGANTLTEDKLAQLQKDYEDATIDIRRFQDDKNREGQKMQTEGLREIEKQLQPVFEKIRDEGGYDLILNNVAGVVVMANERVDITQTVIEALNAAAAAPAAGGN
ncbi:MAG: OmpH family outer membrane protein [bacterium]|nr:OmpH family outer membrane protein [bacterium]